MKEGIEKLGAPPGLCGSCRHLELVTSRRSAFARCRLADSDPRFPRYPTLPVRSCAGFEVAPKESGE